MQKKRAFIDALKYSLSENGRLSGSVYSLPRLFLFPLVPSRLQAPRNAVPRRVKTRHYISGRGIRPRMEREENEGPRGEVSGRLSCQKFNILLRERRNEQNESSPAFLFSSLLAFDRRCTREVDSRDNPRDPRSRPILRELF